MKRRIISGLMIAALLLSMIPNLAYAQELNQSYSQDKMDAIVQKYDYHENMLNTMFGTDTVVGYWGTVNDIKQNGALTWALDMSSRLVGEYPEKQDYAEILANLITMQTGELAEQVETQSRFDDLKDIGDYAWDVVEIAAEFVGASGALETISAAIDTGLSGIDDVIIKNNEQAKYYEAILRDYSQSNEFLRAISQYAENEELRVVASSLIKANDSLLLNRLEYITNVGENIAKYQSEFFLENMSMELLKEAELYSTDETVRLFVDEGINLKNIWSAAQSTYKFTFKTLMLAGDIGFGTSDVYNRYQEMKTVADIAAALAKANEKISVPDRMNQAKLETIQQKCNIYKSLIVTHARGEYLLYQLLMNDSGALSDIRWIVEYFKNPEETTDAWYYGQVEVLTKYCNILDEISCYTSIGVLDFKITDTTETPEKGKELSGKCGDNLTWTLENGILTISGTGAMYDYDLLTFRYAPWHEYREQITDLRIGSGVRNIGNAAFFECGNLRNVVIPGNVKCIGEDAFSWCGWIYDKNLYHVTIEPGVERIERDAFFMGFPMESIDLPDSITYIGEAAFYCCYLKNITIPPNVTYMGGWLFEGDDYYEIEEIHFTGDVPEFAENTFIGVDVTAYYPANNKTWTPDVLKDYGGNVTWIAEGKTDENEKALAAYRPIVEKYNVSSQEQNFGWYSGILIDLDNDNVQELVMRYLSAPFEDAWWSEHKLSVYDYENGKVVTTLDGVTFGEIGGAGEDAYATILYKSGTPYVMTYNDFGETSSGGSMKPNRVATMTIYDGKTCEEVGVYRIERWDNVMSYQIDQRTVSEKEFVSEIEQYQGVEVICDLYQLIEFPETFVTVSNLLQKMK